MSGSFERERVSLSTNETLDLREPAFTPMPVIVCAVLRLDGPSPVFLSFVGQLVFFWPDAGPFSLDEIRWKGPDITGSGNARRRLASFCRHNRRSSVCLFTSAEPFSRRFWVVHSEPSCHHSLIRHVQRRRATSGFRVGVFLSTRETLDLREARDRFEGLRSGVSCRTVGLFLAGCGST